MSSPSQISADLEGRRIELHGLTIELPVLCGASLVLGGTGSGKTTTIVNPLALALATDHAFDARSKAAVIYFGVKGQSHMDFFRSLPEERDEDVIILDPLEPGRPFFLFSEHHWHHGTHRSACVDFVLELLRHLSNSADEHGNHKVYFDGITRAALDTFIEAEPASYVVLEEQLSEDPELRKLFSTDALSCLVFRLEAWLEAQSRKWSGARPEPNKPQGILERWFQLLSKESRQRIQAFQDRLDKSSDNSSSVVLAECSNIVRVFKSDSAKNLLLARRDTSCSYSAAWSFERIIDEGKILIIDLPVSSGAISERAALVALAHAAMSTILRRRQALALDGALNCTRPVVIVADEFHTFLCSKGREEGLDVFISRCREFGAIVILATQSIPLLHSVYRDPMRTESLLSHMRNQFFGFNLCERSNEWASRVCGTCLSPSQPVLVDWHESQDTQNFLLDAKGPLPRLHASELLRLKVGEFYVHLADGKFKKLNATME